MSRPTQASINLDALRHNFKLAQTLAPKSQTLGVVKANAYGHGDIQIAKALEPLTPLLAVASIDEAITLRQAGIQKPVLLMEGPFTEQEIPEASRQNFWLLLHNEQQLEWVANAGCPLRIWLKADSGMHRLGLALDNIPRAFRALKQLSHIHDELPIKLKV